MVEAVCSETHSWAFTARRTSEVRVLVTLLKENAVVTAPEKKFNANA